MMFPQIRCYHSNVSEQPFMFFILSKGDNAGKPGLKPWANSFTVLCNNQQAFDFYFWLTYGLFKAGKFKSRLRGSVISFVNLYDIKEVIKVAAPFIFDNWLKYQKVMKALDLLEQSKTTLGQQLVTTQNLQQHLIRSFFQNYLETYVERDARSILNVKDLNALKHINVNNQNFDED